MSTASALALGAVGLIAAASLDWLMDRSFQFEVAHTSVYMLPVGFVAWACGIRFGAFAALAAAVAELLVSSTAVREPTPKVLGITFFLEILTFLTGAVLMSRMRYLLEEEKNLSRTDPLTGIANGRSFWQSMELEVERMKRDNKPLTVLFVDVDDFKQVNDALGHKGGDRLLKTLGQMLTEVTRSVDSVARIGGDEFAALLPGADATAGLAVSTRLQSSLKTIAPEIGIMPTLSIGLATFKTAPDTVEALLHAADILMYEAKTAGKNRAASRVY